METNNILGFDGPGDYAKVLDSLFRFTRRKLISENIWNYQECGERASDIVSDAIIKYRDQLIESVIIENKEKYIRKIIHRILISRKFIKEKDIAKRTVSVMDASEENIEKVSYSRWIDETNSEIEEKIEDYSERFFNIRKKPHRNLNPIALKVIKLKDEGYRNVDVARTLNLTEGYISKLVQKILKKITRNNWV